MTYGHSKENPNWWRKEAREKAQESLRKKLESGYEPVIDYMPKTNAEKEGKAMKGVDYA